jgi:hypothetical protein
MRTAIFGSWRPRFRWPTTGSFEDFIAAAKELGYELARRGQTVILGGMSPNTADPYIVAGMLEATKGSIPFDPLIEVLRPDDGAVPYHAEARRNPSLFLFHTRSEGWWDGAHLVSIQNADAIITIGGGRGTQLAGLAAIVSKRNLVPIASFGGSSRHLLEQLERGSSPERAAMLRRLNGPWTKYVLESALELCGVNRSPRVLIVHGRNKDWLQVKDWLQRELAIQEVIVMEQQFGDGLTLPEKFERLASLVDAAIAIATPDDIGGPREATTDAFQSRARQNVWLEVGWFWGRLGRTKVLILSSGEIEMPSDLQGLELYRYQISPTEQGDALRSFVRRALQ